MLHEQAGSSIWERMFTRVRTTGVRCRGLRCLLPVVAAGLLIGCKSYKFEEGRWAHVSYNEGVGRRVKPVPGADSASFTAIDKHFAKDKARVYREGVLLTNADPVTFTPMTSIYSKDKSNVYIWTSQISGADPGTFRVVSQPHHLARDKNDYFFGQHRLHVEDLNSFEIVNKGWARDGKCYYAMELAALAIPTEPRSKVSCDYATMRVLSESYAVDKNRAYWGPHPIEQADPGTFRVTGIVTAEDKFRMYQGGSVRGVKR